MPAARNMNKTVSVQQAITLLRNTYRQFLNGVAEITGKKYERGCFPFSEGSWGTDGKKKKKGTTNNSFLWIQHHLLHDQTLLNITLLSMCMYLKWTGLQLKRKEK